MRKIKIVEVKSELAAGTRGASMGIDAIKIASLDKNSDFFTRFEPIVVQDENFRLFQQPKLDWAKYAEGVYTMIDRVCDTVAELRSQELFPIVLAGDHSTAAGTICGIKKAAPDKRLGVIWIDAHADLHSPYTTPSGNMHGMPLAMVSGIDNKECKKNDIMDSTKEIWEKIKKVGGDNPKINAEDIVFIGVRDTEEEEEFLMKKHGIKNFTIEEIQERGNAAVAREALEALKDCDQIYISFDVDSLDSSISVGTGTPVPNGLTKEQADAINSELIKDKRVCCWEIVEVNPTLDNHNQMAENAFDILESTSNSLVENY